MTSAAQAWLALRRPARLLSFTWGDPGPRPRTKVGGAPWWPVGVERPRCADGHLLGFVGQIALADLPGRAADRGLLSFHYCVTCAEDGAMSHGWTDEVGQVGYRITVHEDVGSRAADDLGQLAYGGIPAHGVAFGPIDDWPMPEDAGLEYDHDVTYEAWEACTEPDQIGDGPPTGIRVHTISKVGGWPGWVQEPEWPTCGHGRRMAFVAQLDSVIGEDCGWAAGGLAYLFVCPDGCPERHGELALQTT